MGRAGVQHPTQVDRGRCSTALPCYEAAAISGGRSGARKETASQKSLTPLVAAAASPPSSDHAVAHPSSSASAEAAMRSASMVAASAAALWTARGENCRAGEAKGIQWGEVTVRGGLTEHSRAEQCLFDKLVPQYTCRCIVLCTGLFVTLSRGVTPIHETMARLF